MHRPRAFLLRCALSTTLAVSCALPIAAAAIALKDPNGREVAVSDPSRIVSIGGAITEILYALGLEQRVVAVDTTSVFPARALKEKPNVGYMRALSPEGVLGLAPTLVLAAEGAGPKEAVAVLAAAKVPFVSIPDHYTADGIVEKIRLIAAANKQEKRGDCLVSAVTAEFDALARLRTRVEKPLKVMFVLSLISGKPMVAGRNTAAEGVIRLAGAANAIDAYEGYKPINEEAIAAAAPDAILVMRGSQQPLDAKTLFAMPGFALTPAAQRNAFVIMDGLYLLGFGPRTASAAHELVLSLYPALGRDGAAGEPAAKADACRH